MAALDQPGPQSSRASSQPLGSQPLSRRARALIALVFFLAAFLHANLWGAIVPLWQIPDEAAHYEYVRLMVKLGRPPTPADADPELQAQMLRSMWENNYWEYLGYRRPEQPPKRILPGGWTAGGAIPDTAVIDDAYVYAFSQLQNSTPAYYAMLAPVQAAVIHLPIDDQLRALRMASRVIFALGVLFIVLTAGELFRWNLPAVLATGLICVLQPMFVYIGSGVNNDNGVMLFASALTWQLAAGWRRGFSWLRLALIAVAAVLAVLSKRTGVFLVVWVPLALAVWLLTRMARRQARRLAIVAGAAVAVAIAAAVGLYLIPGPTPANWRSATHWQPTWTVTEAVDGQRAFALRQTSLTASFKRPFGLADDSVAVVEAWVKGVPGAQGSLTLSEDGAGAAGTVAFGEQAGWHAVSATLRLSSATSRLTLVLQGATDAPVYIDAVRAYVQTAEGIIPLPAPNPSAEEALPLLGQVILEIARPLGVYGQAVRVVRDYRANLAALPERLPQAIAFVQQSYWGKFGIFARAQTPTLHIGWVTMLALLAGAALGNAASLIARREPDPATATLMGLWLAGGALLIAQTFAPLLSFAAEGLWLPQGRYLFGGMGMIAPVIGFVGRKPALVLALASVLTLLSATLAVECLIYFTNIPVA